MNAANWRQLLSDFQLGWEENLRQSCFNNLPTLDEAARAASSVGKGAAVMSDVRRQAARLSGTRLYCPDGGEYQVTPDGLHVTCTIHGSPAAPKQMAAPAKHSPTGQLMNDLQDVTAELTFLEDGLHAVVTVNRK